MHRDSPDGPILAPVPWLSASYPFPSRCLASPSLYRRTPHRGQKGSDSAPRSLPLPSFLALLPLADTLHESGLKCLIHAVAGRTTGSPRPRCPRYRTEIDASTNPRVRLSLSQDHHTRKREAAPYRSSPNHPSSTHATVPDRGIVLCGKSGYTMLRRAVRGFLCPQGESGPGSFCGTGNEVGP
jgi:hypothetical protein